MKHPKVMAIGEFGLDDGHAHEDENIFVHQQKVFQRHIELALRHGKPMVLHLRGHNSTKAARSIMLDMEIPSDWPIHMHCFTDSWQECQKWCQDWTKMKFGLTSDHFYAEVAKNLTLDKILLETDAPYFYPRRVNTYLF